MNDLRTDVHNGREAMATDGIVSHMLMGFVERKVSPHTIADALRAQIFESAIRPDQLDQETCNGILEAVTQAQSIATEECSDLVLYLSTHPKFPQCLSFRAAVGSLRVLLQTRPVPALITSLSTSLVQLFQTSRQTIDPFILEDFVLFLKEHKSSWDQLLANNQQFQHLLFVFCNSEKALTHKSGDGHALPKAYAMLALLLSVPEEQLAANTVSYYRTETSDSRPLARLQCLTHLLESLQEAAVTGTKKAFLVEWLFEGALLEAAKHDHLAAQYTAHTKQIVNSMEHHGAALMRGFITATQRDLDSFSLAGNTALDRPSQDFSFFFKANRLAQSFFPHCVALAKSDMALVNRNFASWALEIPCAQESSRLFDKNHWRWIKSLASQEWNPNLWEPPSWVIQAGSMYCAIIFHHAPASWLHDHAVVLVEQLRQETRSHEEPPNAEQTHYVEYLIRCLRKKSPWFASRTESLYALALLSCLSATESTQYTNAKIRFQTMLTKQASSPLWNTPEGYFWKCILTDETALKKRLGSNTIVQALTIFISLIKMERNTTPLTKTERL